MLQFRVFKRERLTIGVYAEYDHRVQSQAIQDGDDPYRAIVRLGWDDNDEYELCSSPYKAQSRNLLTAYPTVLTVDETYACSMYR